MFAEVMIDIGHEQINQTYDYLVPDAFSGMIERGMRVIVPFGTMTRLGFVIAIKESSHEATKTILEVKDVIPTVNEESFAMIAMLASTTGQPYGRLFQTVVANELMMSYRKEAILIDESKVDPTIRALFDRHGKRRLKTNDHIHLGQLRKLLKAGLIEIRTVIEQRGKALHEASYRFNYEHGYNRIGQYPSVTDLFRQQALVSRKDMIREGITVNQISTLEKHDVLIKEEVRVNRPFDKMDIHQPKSVQLTPRQNEVVREIFSGPSKTTLLHGVTGSGKTEIYIEAIRRMKDIPGQVLVLVPEIAMIALMARRLNEVFDDVALYHSGLSDGVRHDQFDMIITGQSSIVIGTRSAVFLPFEKLKLIIVDEEHDDQYIQKMGVYYDARDIVSFRRSRHDAILILGSATPRVTSKHQALNHEYNHVELNERPFGIPLPTLHLVDMKDELRHQNTGVLSRQLADMIRTRIDRGEQSILLFNRKGYAPYVLCRQCGYVPVCPTCGISLTYYKDQNALICGYCGHKEPYSNTCPMCHFESIREAGAGLDYVTERVQKVFPEAVVIKMDSFATKTKGSYERIWKAFETDQADILIGTEMVAKGLDFPKVTLAAVLMADQAFRVPSYLADEQAYQLFAQLTGRSGRVSRGEALIQGYDLDHIAIRGVSEGYQVFFDEALHKRKILNYPPYGSVGIILLEGPGYLETFQEAFMLKKILTKTIRTVLGPSPARLKKRGSSYRFNLFLKDDTLDFPMIFATLKGIRNTIRATFVPEIDEGK